MNRRHWPAVLALLSVAIFGSYLLYTQHLVRQIRSEAAIQHQIYADVQRGLLSNDASAPMEALLALQDEIKKLGVPVVMINAQGHPSAAYNIPFHADLNKPADALRLLHYAARLRQDNNGFISEPGIGEIYFGAPPILKGLRWIPWLQVSGGIVVLLLAFGLIRINMRAERERLWAAMARELAHQMGTPLSSMSGWLEVLALPPQDRRELGDDAQLARELGEDVERLERVSRRFELIGKPPALERTDIVSLLDDLEHYLRPRLPRLGAGVEFSVRVAGPVPDVNASRDLLVWALENLVKNALDALAGRGGRIHVLATQGARGGTRIAVTDDGPGVSRQVRDRLFEPGVSTKAAGWGVGLSLTRRIVEDLHHGRISVKTRQGGGTAFIIELPGADRGVEGKAARNDAVG